MATTSPLHARDTYDGLAPHYDCLTADYDHHTWLGRLLRLAGATGPRVLDLACGTGRSFAPLIGQGYEISACDISRGMLSVARRRFDLGGRRLFVADMRDLPECGPFDLITCLDDAVNYLCSPAELARAFHCVARVLDRDGVFLFDTNTLHTYRTAFASATEIDAGAERFRWRGLGSPVAAPGGQAVAVVERPGVDLVETIATHRQRHYAIDEVVGLLASAGLAADAIVGQSTGCRVTRSADDLRATKTVFLARRSGESGEVTSVTIKP
jgi:SAM-dependent methyltransferase